MKSGYKGFKTFSSSHSLGLASMVAIAIVFLLCLAIMMTASLVYVDSVLTEYEAEHPTRHLERAVELLKAEADDGSLWEKDGVPSMSGGKFEPSDDPKADFINRLSTELIFTSANTKNDNEYVYGVISNGIQIAEVTLKKIGEPATKLAIIPIQKYELVSYLPTSHTYTLTLPDDVLLGSDVNIEINGIQLTKEDGQRQENGNLVFTISDIYTKPEIKLTDNNGNVAAAKISESNVLSFDSTFYTLTLPDSLFVTLDGEKLEGDICDDGRYLYRIRLAKKVKVELLDLYGNTVEYTGNSSVPLTCYSLMCASECNVSVDGKNIPSDAMEISANPEYKNFAELVPELPKLPVYTIVVLKDDAVVSITDANGRELEIDPEKTVQDLTGASAPIPLDNIPEEVSAEIDVLKVLKDWSLFMSCDLDFNSLSKHLIKSSYQYNIAYKYNNSIDRQFTSPHTLRSPAFSGETATNFTWLTDDCFSVDIHFVKHMRVAGQNLDDEMNERCYFAKERGGEWKLIGMKEVIDNAK